MVPGFTKGVDKEYIMVLPKIIFYLLQDGCRSSTPNEVIRAELAATI